jgi:hypothetical protein
MALTTSPTMAVTISVMDRDRNTSTLGFYVVNGGLLSVIEAAITGTMIPAIQAIMDCVVTAYTITTGAEDHTPVLPGETSDVERKGVFSFRAANGASYVIAVPSIKNTMVVDETNKINKVDTAIAAFIDMILTGSVLGIAHPVTYLGSDIVSLEKAVKTHRGSGVG